MIIYTFVFIFGAVIGSFLNVCIYRLPRNLSVVFPSSGCPSCGGIIRFYDNIPILSYLLLRGRCRKCRSGISWVYPLVEFLNATLYVLTYYKFFYYSVWVLVTYFVFISALIVITFIDLEHMIIPDRITLPGIPLALVAGAAILPDPFSRMDSIGLVQSFIGLIFGGGFFYLIAVTGKAVFKKPAMGGGDIKLMALVGCISGWKGVMLTTFAGSLIGSVVGILLILIKGRSWSSKIPFGPYLTAGAVVSLFWGQELFMWYLNAG